MDDVNIVHNIKILDNIENGQMVEVELYLPISIGWIENVNFIINGMNNKKSYLMYHVSNDDKYVKFKTVIDMETCAVYNYHFTYQVGNITKYVLNDIQYDYIDLDKRINKLSINFKTPDWAKGKIMYHIFIDRFRRGNKEKMINMKNRTIHNNWNEDIVIGKDDNGIWNADYYGGDLLGVIESLDYIKSLGVSIIYLSPIFWSQSNHRYDTSDYEIVDPYVGVNDDLKLLCDSAHQKGIRIILDAVFNHTGNDSKYFNEYGTFDTVGAYQSSNSIYFPFYKKNYNNNKVMFHYWWGMTNLPVCDCNSNEWIEYITGNGGIIDKWFQLGIDGLRLDVADELTDEFIEKIRESVHRNKSDGLIIGEVWKNPMRMSRGYLESGKGMDTVMNYQLIDALIRYFKYADVNKIEDVLKSIDREYPEDTINTLMNFTSTHDISRAINIFGCNDFNRYGEWAWDINERNLEWYKNYKLSSDEYKKGRDMYEAYIFSLTFMPGILSIFYGDEVGLEGMGNLANRRTYPWSCRDKKLLSFFRDIGKIRGTEKFLESADFNILDINSNYMMFERIFNDNKVLIAVNRTDLSQKFIYPDDYKNYSKIYSLKKSRLGNLNNYGAVAIKK